MQASTDFRRAIHFRSKSITSAIVLTILKYYNDTRQDKKRKESTACLENLINQLESKHKKQNKNKFY